MTRITSQIATLVGFVLMVAILGGCTEVQSPRSTTSDITESTASSDITESTASPQSSNELRVAFPVDPQTLDPRMTFDITAESQMQHMFEHLWNLDQSGNLSPRLATEWEWVDDVTLRVVLREGVTFHDGSPLTSESVKFSIESMLDPEFGSPKAGFLSEIESVEPVSDHEVLFHLSRPSRPLLRNLTYYGLIMSEAAAADAGDSVAQLPVGTGPYRFVEYLPGQRLVVEANPDYWGRPPSIPRIVFEYIAEDGTRVGALLAGDVDFIAPVPLDSMDQIAAQPGLEVSSEATSQAAHVGLKHDRPGLDEESIREALNYAVDKEAIIDAIFGGRADIMTSIVAPIVWSHSPQEVYEYDPERARQLLSEAGLDEGFELVFGAPNGRYPKDREIAEAIAGYLEAVGVEVDLRLDEWGTFIGDAFSAESTYDIYYLEWALNSMEPDFIFSPYFHSDFGTLPMYDNPDADRLIDAGKTTIDVDEAALRYEELQELLWDDAVWIFLVYRPDVVAYDADLRNWERSSGNLVHLFNNAVFDN